MLKMAVSYLHTCLERFEKVSEERYGWPFNLKAIEDDVRHLRSKRKITSQDLLYFTNPERWWFDHFWVLPTSTQVDALLEKATFDFHQLSPGNEGSKKERQTIESLLEVFRSIELVSIILRFVRPESFGIVSPPVEQVLSVRRGFDAAETYLHYLSDLRAIRDHYKFVRAADADMALWVLHYFCFTVPPINAAIKQEFNKDPFLLRIQAKNLVAPLSEITLSRLAQALASVRVDLAGLVGAYSFESAIRERAIIKGVPLTARNERGKLYDLDLEAIVNALHEKHQIDGLTAGKWNRFRLVRNKVIHGKLTAPSAAELRDLIDEVLSIEQGNAAKSS
jgi:hypothetical protein